LPFLVVVDDNGDPFFFLDLVGGTPRNAMGS
jgi:hypothetical protein